MFSGRFSLKIEAENLFVFMGLFMHRKNTCFNRKASVFCKETCQQTYILKHCLLKLLFGNTVIDSVKNNIYKYFTHRHSIECAN